MKKFLKHFAVFFIIIGVLGIIVAAITIFDNKTKVQYVRTNTESLMNKRVFDFADKLTDEEEKQLSKLIAEKENEVGCDIVIMTVNDPTLDSDYAMMNYADDFYDNNKYGYDKPWGDGAIYVDNWYNGYVWFSTSGRVETCYSTSMINSLIDKVCNTVNYDTFGAYKTYVNSLSDTMSGKNVDARIPTFAILLAAFIISVIYLIVGLVGSKGKKTTNEKTYVVGGQPKFNDRRDIFITKHTTSRRIESSSSGGGGGGHHMSSGGHSHGGGGGRH